MIRLPISRTIAFFNRPIFTVGLLVFLGAILRRYHLAAKSLWLDEAMLYQISQGHVWDILYKNATMSSAPPLYPFLLHVVQIFGDSELILRGLSVLAGVIAIPLLYMLLRKWLSYAGAWFVTALFTTAISQIMYSQQVREYSLTVLFSIWMIYTTWRYLEKPDRRNIVTLTIVWSVGIWLQYGLAVLALALNLIFAIHWLKRHPWQSLFQWTIGQILPFLSIVLIYFLSLRYQFVAGGSGIQYLASGYWDPATRSLPAFVFDQTLELIHFTFSDWNFFPFLLFIGLAAGLLDKGKRPILPWVFIPVGVTLALGLLRVYPYLGTRHDIFLTPLIFLLCGTGIDYLLKHDTRRIVISALMVVLLFTNFQSVSAYYQSPGDENTRPILNQLKTNLQPGDRVYVYYAAEYAFRYYLRDQTNPVFYGSNHRGNLELYFSEMEPFLQAQGRIWLFFTHCYQKECDQIRDYVNTNRPVQLVQSDSQVFLYLSP